MYKIAICDDDRNYRQAVREIVDNTDMFEREKHQFFEYENGEMLLMDAAVQHDIVFIDIHMPGLDGNKTAELLRDSNKRAVLVYCSNYFEPTPDGINIGQPFKYILKDMEDEALKKEMPLILREARKRKIHERRYITVTGTGRVSRVCINDVLYISVAKRGCYLYINNEQQKTEEIRCRESIKELYQQLEQEGFEYAHNSYIVNLKNVVDLKRTVVEISGGIELNVSRSKRKCLEEKFWNVLQEG